jgi:hypothetical protein
MRTEIQNRLLWILVWQITECTQFGKQCCVPVLFICDVVNYSKTHDKSWSNVFYLSLMGNQVDWLKNGCNQIFVAQISYQEMCTDIVICQINCAVYCNVAHMRVVHIRLVYGCASDYGQSQIVITWLCMIPAVDHVLCNRRAILEHMKIMCHV